MRFSVGLFLEFGLLWFSFYHRLKIASILFLRLLTLYYYYSFFFFFDRLYYYYSYYEAERLVWLRDQADEE